MANRTARPRKTWSLLGDVRRKPSTYEVTAALFQYHFRREPAPFELDPGMPMNRWYLTYREGSPFQVDDWEGFHDPHKLTYKDYVALQHDHETYLDLLIDTHEAASGSGSVTRLDPAWVATLRAVFVPLRFPLHVLQMTGLYIGQMAPSAFIANAAHFGAADEMRRIQRIAYWTKVLANAHGDELASTALARGAWEDDPAWQPLRRACEQLLVTRDWGEAFAARNLAVKPALDALLNNQFAELAQRNSDEFLALLFTEFGVDSQRSQDWSAALVRYALEHKPELREVLTGWLGTWQPRAVEAAEPLSAAFATAPVPIAANHVTGAVREQHRAFLQTCGL
jgi:toluene monooxygenase system protein E